MCFFFLYLSFCIAMRRLYERMNGSFYGFLFFLLILCRRFQRSTKTMMLSQLINLAETWLCECAHYGRQRIQSYVFIAHSTGTRFKKRTTVFISWVRCAAAMRPLNPKLFYWFCYFVCWCAKHSTRFSIDIPLIVGGRQIPCDIYVCWFLASCDINEWRRTTQSIFDVQ